VEATLRRRSQFAPEPTRYFQRFHRIGWLNHALMNVTASDAFQCSDGNAGRPASDPYHPRCGFAVWTWWPVKNTHDVVPYIGQGAHRTLSHRQTPLRGGDGKQSSMPVSRHTDQYRPFLGKINGPEPCSRPENNARQPLTAAAYLSSRFKIRHGSLPSLSRVP
jgi:hypothetical protein